MIAYWDASALALLYVDLPASAAARAHLAESELTLISKLAILEAYRAFASLAAGGKIARKQARLAAEKLRVDQLSFNARSIDATLQGAALEKYIALLERHSLLGTNDVVHLATAVLWRNELRRSVTLITRDVELAAAARKERLSVRLPGS